MGLQGRRPVYLDLQRIRLPVSGMVSILHRVSGIILYISTPFVAYLLELSLRNSEGYAQAAALLNRWPVQLWFALACWSLFHHLLAGLRVLLIDFDIGVARETAFRSARWVLVGAVVLASGAWLAL